MPDNIVNIIKRYCGEIAPNILYPNDKRRMSVNEFLKEEQKELINWIGDNKTLIVSDILKGRGKFSAEWMLIAQKIEKKAKWIIKPINFVMNYYSNGDIVITKRGVIHIERITIQRKGGDGGRPTANMLQFKIDPTELFDLV